MKSKYLFPHRFKLPATLLLVPLAAFGLYLTATDYSPAWLDVKVPAVLFDQIFEDRAWFKWSKNNILNEIVGILLIITSIIASFSRERVEDEYTAKLRLDSLAWAVYLNYAVLIVSFIFFYDFTFLWVMIFNIFTILWFFIIRFNWKLYLVRKALSDEK